MAKCATGSRQTTIAPTRYLFWFLYRKVLTILKSINSLAQIAMMGNKQVISNVSATYIFHAKTS